MINKIRDLMHLKDLIDELGQKTEELVLANEKSAKSANDLKTELEQLHELYKGHIRQARKDTAAMQDFRETLNKELYEFHMFKREMKNEFHKKIEKELNMVRGEMEKEVRMFNDTKSKIDGKLSNLEKLDEDVNRLCCIAQNLKAADFELVKHHKNLKNHEEEKFMLLKKIDALERLIAKMRRC